MLAAEPGTYALVCVSSRTKTIEVGRQGRLGLQPGCYLYVGSAFGPGGVAARVEHHRRRSLRPHWHIDYLRRHTRLDSVWLTYDPLPREHLWAHVLSAAPKCSVPLDGFGSSDCGCRSHLFYFEDIPSLHAFAALVHAADRSHGEVHEFRLDSEA